MNARPHCQIVAVHTFRGDRIPAFRSRLFRMFNDERTRSGPGPSITDCLLFAGHSGISTDPHRVIYGFNPDGGTASISQVMRLLRSGDAYPGIVRDDTLVFRAAQHRGLPVLRFDVALSPSSFKSFGRKLTVERKGPSKYRYGFPDGDGDCNCTTWLERLGLPLLTGRMDELTVVSGVAAQVRRRFGVCM
jgi:hypothetical protein